MAGFNSPLFLLGLSGRSQQAGFRGPLPLPQVGVEAGQQAGYQNALPLPQFGARSQQQAGYATPIPLPYGWAGEFIPPEPEPIRERIKGGGGYYEDDEEILAVIMAAALRWDSGTLH